MNPRTTPTSRSLIGKKTLTATLTALAVFAIALGVRAQQGQDRPIQVGSVDFTVVNATGEPVPGLKPEEVTLRIDGKIRVIKTLTFVTVSSGMSGAAVAAAPTTEPIAPAFETNIASVAASARSVVIIVDDESMPIGQEQKIRSMLSDFVTKLPPTDQVALVTVPHGGIKVGLTTDRARMRAGIATISPIQPIADAPCRTRDTLSSLQQTIELMARSSDQPVVVAFLSSSLTGVSTAEAAQAPTAAGRGGVSSQGGACYLTSDDFKRVGTATAASRAQLFIIHPDYSLAAAQEGIENLRGQTGAPLFHLSAGTEPGLFRMARETSAYYTATFDTEPDERVGVSHVAAIKTTRKDVELRGRPYIVVGRATPSPSATRTSTAPVVTTAFDLVRSGRAYSDLPLRSTSSSMRTPDGKVNVIGLFEPVDPSTKIMTAAAALINEDGRGVDFWMGEADKLATWPAVVGLSAPPGKYRLRIGAIDANGRTGLVDTTIVAEVAKSGPLQIGGLILGISRGGTFSPRLQFSTEASAVAYLQVYGPKEVTQVGVLFELSLTTNGPAMLQVRGVLAPTAEEGKFDVTGTIPVGALAPGDYVVRAIIAAAGQPEARVLRTLHKGG
jgi:hypothetical protein